MGDDDAREIASYIDVSSMQQQQASKPASAR
jgi:hypothetical protein